MEASIIIVIIAMLVITAISVVQGFICVKVKNSLAGLVIPLISFIVGMIPPLVLAHVDIIARVIVICQIPTVIYLVIFAIVRIILHGRKISAPNQKEIDKMNIQDL